MAAGVVEEGIGFARTGTVTLRKETRHGFRASGTTVAEGGFVTRGTGTFAVAAGPSSAANDVYAMATFVRTVSFQIEGSAGLVRSVVTRGIISLKVIGGRGRLP